MAYVVVWVLEGAARKWLLPEFRDPLYFARVPLVVAMLWNALRPPAKLGLGFGLITCALALLTSFVAFHVIYYGQPVQQAALGLRSYVEPVLVVACSAPLVDRDIGQRVCRGLAYVSPFVLALAVVQSNSPASAFVNRIFLDDGSDNFGLAGATVRATGLFTSSLGHSLFAVLCFASAVALFAEPRSPRDKRLALVAIPTSGLMTVTSGSRSAVLGAGLTVVLLLAIQAARRPERVPRIIAATIVGIGVAVVVAPRLAADSVTALNDRFTGASADLRGRTIDSVTGWIPVFGEQRAVGQGLAALNQGFARTGGSDFSVEGELVRQLYELGPALFLVLLAVRVAAVLTLLTLAARSLRQPGDSFAAVLCAAALTTWSYGSVTGQSSVTGFAAIAAVLAYSGTRHVDYRSRHVLSGVRSNAGGHRLR